MTPDNLATSRAASRLPVLRHPKVCRHRTNPNPGKDIRLWRAVSSELSPQSESSAIRRSVVIWLAVASLPSGRAVYVTCPHGGRVPWGAEQIMNSGLMRVARVQDGISQSDVGEGGRGRELSVGSAHLRARRAGARLGHGGLRPTTAVCTSGMQLISRARERGRSPDVVCSRAEGRRCGHCTRGVRRDVARTLCLLWDGAGERGRGGCRVFAARGGKANRWLGVALAECGCVRG